MLTKLQSTLMNEIGTLATVKVYRNLRNKCYSVQYKGKVVAHLDEVILKEVQFKVNEAGRQRVIATKQKNVHAYCTGTLTCFFDPAEETRQVTYNPYKDGHFYNKTDNTPIYQATHAILSSGGIEII